MFKIQIFVGFKIPCLLTITKLVFIFWEHMRGDLADRNGRIEPRQTSANILWNYRGNEKCNIAKGRF